MHPRRHRSQLSGQMAMIPRDVLIGVCLCMPQGDRPCYIKAYHGCYDPLAYPLFKPKGETGWNKFMTYNDIVTDKEGHTSVDPTEAVDLTSTEHDLISNALIKRMGTY